ncbi:MAG TPA: lysylphosphatidylglycerol synthase transmembrane domain-containing protein [bacterium]|nr:lysylphosphatidylglycerol synthase transmembrane domain-containing protein [bacterium]
MKQKTKKIFDFKIKFKSIFFPVLMFVVVVIIFLKFSELKSIGQLFQKANWWWLLAALGSQLIAFMFQGNVYHKIFGLLDFHKFNFFKLLRAAVTIVFLNFTIPSLGFAGNIYFLKILKKHGFSEGKGLLAIILEFVCFYLSFILLLIISFGFLFFKLHVLGKTQAYAILGFAGLLLLIYSVLHFTLGNKKKAKKIISWFAKKINYVGKDTKNELWIDELLTVFYQDVRLLKQKKIPLAKIIFLQFFRFLWDSVTIYLLFLSFGAVAPISLTIIAPNIGRLFGLLTFLPGGIGTFEGSMVLVFNSLGVQLELALAVMLLYRFFSYWLYFPLGIIFYRQLEKEENVLTV